MINLIKASLVLLFFTMSSISYAQSIYYNHGQEDFLRVEFNKPLFGDNSGIGFLSFDSFLNGEFTVGKKNKIGFELPYSRVSIDNGIGNNSSSEFGNIALVYQIRDLVKPNYLEFKLRLPTSSEPAVLPTLFSDYTERLTSSFPDLISIESSYNFESKNTSGLYYRVRPGLKLLIPTDTDANDGAELLFDANILGGYRNKKFDLNAGITTTAIITEEEVFDDRVLRQLFTSFTYNAGSFKPGLILRLPMGDFSEIYDVAVGLHLTYTIGGTPSKISVDNTSN